MTDIEYLLLVSFRSAKSWRKAEKTFESLAYAAGVPDNWKDPDSGIVLAHVVQQIEDHLGTDLFEHRSSNHDNE